MSLQRYVSRELAHFVARADREDSDKQFEVLAAILIGGVLRAYEGAPEPPSYAVTTDYSKKISDETMLNADMVCFCDIPPDDLQIHVGKYGPFGLSFLKTFLLPMGASPVFYVAMDASARITGPDKTRAEHYDEQIQVLGALVQSALWTQGAALDPLGDMTGISERWERLGQTQEAAMFIDTHLLSYLKFFEASRLEDDPENFYMEREWRVLGSVRFDLGDVYRVYLPARYASEFRSRFPDYAAQLTFVEA